MNKPTCSVESCESISETRGWCKKHYAKWLRYGKPEGKSPAEFFWELVDKSGECWVWTGNITPLGYGSVKRNYKNIPAHRYSWLLSGREIAAGNVLDHLCHNRACVNPDHLRSVTQAQNSQNRNGAPRNSTTGIRGVSFEAARNAYTAKFRLAGKDHYLGAFATAAEAEAAVIKGRREHMTHSEMDKAVS